MRRLKETWAWDVGCGLISIGCIFFYCPPFSITPLVYISLIPVFLILTCTQRSAVRKLVFVWLHGWLLGSAIHYWLYYSIREFGNYGQTPSVLLTLASGILTSFEFIFAGCVAIWCTRYGQVKSILSYGLVLFGFSLFPDVKYFPWTLADPQVLIQELSALFFVFGRGGALCFVLFLNVLLACMWRAFRLGLKSDLILLCRDMTFVVLICVVSYMVRAQLIHPDSSTKVQGALRVVVIQARVLNMMKQDAFDGHENAVRATLKTYFDLTQKGISALTPPPSEENPVLLVWPETAYPLAYPDSPRTHGPVINAAFKLFLQKYANVHFIFGGSGFMNGKLRNYMTWMYQGEIQGHYNKRRLLALGEYLPFRDWLSPELAYSVWPYLDQVPGEEMVAWDLVPGVRVQPSICYEVLFSDMSHHALDNRVGLFLNLTNDAWFVVPMAKRLHLLMAQVQSATTGIPMVRSTNTGITTVIDAFGKVARPLSQDEAAILYETPSIRPSPMTGSGWLWVQKILSFFLFLVWLWRAQVWLVWYMGLLGSRSK